MSDQPDYCEFCEIDGYGLHAPGCPVTLEAKLGAVEAAKREAFVLLDKLWAYVDSLPNGPRWGQDKTTWLIESHRQALLRLNKIRQIAAGDWGINAKMSMDEIFALANIDVEGQKND